MLPQPIDFFSKAQRLCRFSPYYPDSGTRTPIECVNQKTLYLVMRIAFQEPIVKCMVVGESQQRTIAGYNEKFIKTLDEPFILMGHSQCGATCRTNGNGFAPLLDKFDHAFEERFFIKETAQ